MANPVADALITFGITVPPEKLFPAASPEASAFATHDAFAFALATCLDRGTLAQIIWTIPFDMRGKLGHLDPCRITRMTTSELADLIDSLPHRPRYKNDAPRTVHEIASLVCGHFNGDAAGIWRNQTAAEVKSTFLGIFGVGPGIASMAVLLIEAAFGLRFPDIDRPLMDIKPDVHTMRVLYRLGVATAPTESAARAGSRAVHPEFPGGLDAPLWILGREYCHAIDPKCSSCPVATVCARVGMASPR